MRMVIYKDRDGVGRVTFDEMDLIHMPEEAVLIERCNQALDLIKRVRTQLTLLGLPVRARVLWSN